MKVLMLGKKPSVVLKMPWPKLYGKQKGLFSLQFQVRIHHFKTVKAVAQAATCCELVSFL